MSSSPKARIGIIRDDPQSSFLADVFNEPELCGLTTVFVFDIRELRRCALFRLVNTFYRYVLRKSPSMAFSQAEHLSVLIAVRFWRISHLVALDNKLELLAKIGDSLRHSGTRCFAIQLGTNPQYYSAEAREVSRIVPVKMLCWGSREVSEYVRSGLVPEDFSIVGSLKLSIAERRNPKKQVEKWDICLVSQFRPTPNALNKVSAMNKFEAQSMPELIRLLRPVIIRHQLRMVVAVKASRRIYEPSLEQQEIDFYQFALGDVAEIGLSENPYASYALAESSRLVIGRNSALLTEMLASQARVLFVNPTEFEMHNAFDEVPNKLIRPSPAVFEAKVLAMLNESSEEYARKVNSSIRKLCVRVDDTFAEVARALELIK